MTAMLKRNFSHDEVASVLRMSECKMSDNGARSTEDVDGGDLHR